MNLDLPRRLHRPTDTGLPQVLHGHLTGLVFVALACFASLPAAAEQFDCSDQFLGCEPSAYSCDVEQEDVAASNQHEELCGWADDQEEELCGWATHDSCPIAAETIASRTLAAFDRSIATAAATACAKAGISIEQIIEPLAMVQPQLSQAPSDDSVTATADAKAGISVQEIIEPFISIGPQFAASLDQIKQFQQWWKTAIEASKAQQQDVSETSTQASVASDAESSINDELQLLADEEPIDIDLDALGPSVLILVEEQTESSSPAPVSIPDASVSQVGASAIIVSLEDAYMPYDLSARDLRVWSVFPLVTEPFCIRSRTECEPIAPIWEDSEETVAADDSATDDDDELVLQAPTENSFTIHGSPDCLLDELIWNIEVTLLENSHWLDPATYGDQLADFARQGTDVAESAAGSLASLWPNDEADTEVLVEQDEPTAGDRLLARAEAVEAGETAEVVESAEPVRIAEAPGTTVR